MSDLLGLGLEPKDLSLVHVCLRGFIVFIAALVMVRLADRRFLGKMSALDVILGFALASMLARAINGSAAFFPTLGGGFALVFLHRLLAMFAFYSDGFGRLVKGEAEVLVEDGHRVPQSLRRHKITEKDLLEEIRLEGQALKVESVKTATIERNGKVSVIPKAKD